jgi:hypothetical protein
MCVSFGGTGALEGGGSTAPLGFAAGAKHSVTHGTSIYPPVDVT